MIKCNNIILAGVARSGSTLACHLLNKTSDAVALHEPIVPAFVPVSSSNETVKFLQNFFEKQRDSILSKGIATSKSTQGKVPDNPRGDIDNKTGKRIKILDGKVIKVEKALKDDFLLVIKQPGLFTGLLGSLKQHFPCYATIRNPLAVLQSWNTVDMAVTTGHAPAAERCDKELKFVLAQERDVYNRQIILLSWYYEQFYKHLPIENIIRYEKVVLTGGKELARIVSSANQLSERLVNKNNNPLYDNILRKELATRLLESEGYYWNYYKKNDVTDLLNT